MIRINNYSPHSFRGWIRTTTDDPNIRTGWGGGWRIVVGRERQPGVRDVDVWRGDLSPGMRTVDTNLEEPFEIGPPPTPETFGGVLRDSGIDVTLVAVRVNGAAWESEFTAGPDTRGWLRYYPDMPGIVQGELLMVADGSSWLVPDLKWGNAIVLYNGGTPKNDNAADGQARVIPITFLWLDQLNPKVLLLVQRAIGACGIQKLLHDGNPVVEHDARAWAAKYLRKSMEVVQTWGPPAYGVTPASGSTGAQSDQTFVGGEALVYPGAEHVTYLNALKMANRPCHYLERDGSQVDPANHPNLVLWEMRPHGSGSDTLGRPTGMPANVPGGWSGADPQHWLINGLAAACRLTSSDACQWLLRAQGLNYLAQWLEPGRGYMGTTTDSARTLGWEGIGVVHLWRELEDRELAERVKQRWLDRWGGLIWPHIIANEIWDIRTDDPRLGAGQWWIPWQQSVGAYGLMLACRVFGQTATSPILRGAARVLRDAWRKEGDRWQTAAQRPVDAAATADWNESFNYYGMSLAAHVCLDSPDVDTRERAQSIWQQLRHEASTPEQCRWLAPVVDA